MSTSLQRQSFGLLMSAVLGLGAGACGTPSATTWTPCTETCSRAGGGWCAANEVQSSLDDVAREAESLARNLFSGSFPEDAEAAVTVAILRHDAIVEIGFAARPEPAPSPHRLRAGTARRGEHGIAWTTVQEDYDLPASGSETPGQPAWIAQVWAAHPHRAEGRVGAWIGTRCNDRQERSLVRYGVPHDDGVLYVDVDARVLSDPLEWSATWDDAHADTLRFGGRTISGDDWDAIFGHRAGCSSESPDPAYQLPAPVRPRERGIETEAPPTDGGCYLAPDDFTIAHHRHTTRTAGRAAYFRAMTIALAAVFALAVMGYLWVRRADALRDRARVPSCESAAWDHGTRRWSLASWTVAVGAGLVWILAAIGAWHWPAVSHVREFRPLHGRTAVARFVRDETGASLASGRELPVLVPTGVYVQSVGFKSARELLVTGILWQRYPIGLDPSVDRGFLMPESSSAEIHELYRRRAGDEEVIGWHFKVELNQEFNYTYYPFGEQQVWLQLWHKQFHDDVILVPDVDAYKSLAPEDKPGLRRDLDISGWEVTRTEFAYSDQSYSTDFGTDNFPALTDFPELHFNIVVRSSVLQPLVAYLLPMGVIFLLLYVILVLGSRRMEVAERRGFNAMNVVATGSGFFLVAVFTHADLRNKLSLRGFNYLEVFYLGTYLAILLVVFNALLLATAQARPTLRYGDTFPKLVFWPIAMTLDAAVTIWWFAG